MRTKIILLVVLLCGSCHWVNAQRASAARIGYLVNIIDSLDAVVVDQKAKINSLDSLLKAERAVTAGLRKDIDVIAGQKKQLEENVDTFQGENLKLSQSNRILIVFNSFVAVLLIVTLVFYLRKMNKKPVVLNNTVSKPAAMSNASVHASLEDKLQQLERLGKLREKGFLSDDEFVAEKNRVLGK